MNEWVAFIGILLSIVTGIAGGQRIYEFWSGRARLRGNLELLRLISDDKTLTAAREDITREIDRQVHEQFHPVSKEWTRLKIENIVAFCVLGPYEVGTGTMVYLAYGWSTLAVLLYITGFTICAMALTSFLRNEKRPTRQTAALPSAEDHKPAP